MANTTFQFVSEGKQYQVVSPTGLSLKKIAGVLTIARLNFPRHVMACDRYFEVHMVYFTAQLLLKTF